MHAGATGGEHHRDHVDVAGATFHALLVLHAAQHGDLITQFSGALELQGHRGLFHAGRELLAQCIAAAIEKHHRVAHVLGVLLWTDQADAGTFAAFDLVLQARSRAVLVVTVLALANQKGLLQQAQALANRQCTGIRAEIAPLGFLRPPVNAEPWKVAVGEKHIRVGFVVAQQDVVRRPPFLDQGLLEQQCLGLVGGDGGFDLRDTCDQRGRLGCLTGLAKVTGETLLEVFRLADVEQASLAIEHAIDAGATTAGRQEGTRIEWGRHFQLTASTMPWRTASRASSTSLVMESFSKMR